MKTRRTRIASTIADQTLSKGSSKQLANQIAAYLLSERRVGELDSLMRDVQADWAQAGHVEVLASSAHTLTPAVQKDIEKQVRTVYPQATKIIVTGVHDADVVGGVRLNFSGQQLDLSVQAKLTKFKQLTSAGKE